MIIAINKPRGPTSHDIINQIRRITGEKRVGHAGTLDPLASGVLVVAIGRESTKQLSMIVQKEKEYLAMIKLGETSSTDDEEGQKIVISLRQPLRGEIEQALLGFIGEISQLPPQYSALKLSGQPAYKLARAGRAVDLRARNILIKDIKLIDYRWPVVKLKIITGPGVYIRSLARDVGEKLKTGGYLADLVRMRVGQYKLEDSLPIDRLTDLIDKPGSSSTLKSDVTN